MAHSSTHARRSAHAHYIAASVAAGTAARRHAVYHGPRCWRPSHTVGVSCVTISHLAHAHSHARWRSGHAVICRWPPTWQTHAVCVSRRGGHIQGPLYGTRTLHRPITAVVHVVLAHASAHPCRGRKPFDNCNQHSRQNRHTCEMPAARQPHHGREGAHTLPNPNEEHAFGARCAQSRRGATKHRRVGRRVASVRVLT